MTKHDAMKKYFEPWVEEKVEDLLNFNFSPESRDTVSFITNYAGKTVKQFIRGSSRKEYGFSIIIVKSYSLDSDDLNLQAMNFAQAFMDWLEEQNRKRIFPEFPENCRVLKIENMQNMPNLVGINAEASLARYMVQCRLIYEENEVTT